MAHSTLYRKYRPTGWDTVIGQGHIVTTLKNQIAYNMVGHAYLFTGTRGTGKTTSAKIFARAVNCLTPVDGSPCGQCEVCLALQNPTNMDVIEMDAASNNGVDEIRDLRENIQYPPTLGKFKVYIIDEVHMLSTAAFNALLKTLEEPPAHAMFILATTEVHKLPQTILSRCMRFDFRLVAVDELVSLLQTIFADMNYEAEHRALEAIALHGEGSVRDTLSLAETCMSYAPKKLTYSDVSEVLGVSDFETISDMADAMLSGNLSSLLYMINTIYSRGKGITTINKELVTFLRDSLSVKNIKDYKATFTESELPKVREIVAKYDNYRIGRAMDILAGAENLVRYSSQPKIIFESCLVRASEIYTEPDTTALQSRMRTLEKELEQLKKEGIVVAKSATVVVEEDVPPEIDIASELAGLEIDEASEAPIFDNDTTPENNDEHILEEYLSKLLMGLRNSSFMLYHAINELTAKDMSLVDEHTINFNLTGHAIVEMFRHDVNKKELQDAVKRELGADFNITFSTQTAPEVSDVVDRSTLHALFGSHLSDNKKRK
ncbi:MAG: DNA polymerase III subunit gamma/tau [Bacillota bacterium]